MKECHSCGFRIIGLGCTKSGKRVTNHDTCDDWRVYKPERSIHDQAAIEQYKQAGYILDLREVI